MTAATPDHSIEGPHRLRHHRPRTTLRTAFVAVVLAATLPVTLLLAYRLATEDTPSRALVAAFGVALVSAAIGVGLAGWLARRVSASLQQLARGEPAGDDDDPIAVTEIAELRDALEAARRARAAADSALADLAAREQHEQLARRDAQAASHAKDELLSMLGHELRSPLNALVTSAEVLRAAPAGSPVGESARSVVTRQTRKLAALIDRMQETARVMADHITLDLQPVELRDAVEGCVALARPQAVARRSHLEWRAAGPVWVRADPARVAQVMAQLLDNALRHTPPGATVTVEVRHDAGTAVVTVRDTGPGIDADLLARIFEPFAQSRHGLAHAGGGLGVGLAMVKRLAELQGGSVVASSSPGGSAFEWRLPTPG